MTTRPLTLGQFDVPIPLQCFHCDVRLSKSTPIEINAGYVIAHCQKCGCMTPFKLEGVA